jgi:hypothetical protein
MTMAQQVLVAEVGMIRTSKMGKLAYKNKTRLGSSCPVSEAEYREVTANVSRNGANAIMAEGTPEAMRNRAPIANLIRAAGLPASHTIPKFVDAGRLMAYSIDVVELEKCAANNIDAILRRSIKSRSSSFHQPQDREGAWHRRPGNAPGQRQQCHRMKPPPNVAFWYFLEVPAAAVTFVFGAKADLVNSMIGAEFSSVVAGRRTTFWRDGQLLGADRADRRAG